MPGAMSDPAGHFGDCQYCIYLRGMGMGERPELPVAWDALEQAARDKLAEAPRGYVWGGAGTGDTMRANLEALRAWRIVPRHLRAVETRDLSLELLGSQLPAPLALAPIGVQTLVHADGELASARGAAAVGVPYTASTAATHPMESIAQAGGTRWYQLYWPKDDAICESLVRRAEEAGYSAIASRSTPSSWGGARPTSRRATCRSCAPRGSGSSSATRSSARGSSIRRRRRCGRASGTGSPSSTRSCSGTPSSGCAGSRTCRSSSRGSCTATTPGAHATPAWTASSCPTTAVARSTARWRPWMRCLMSPARWGESSPCSSTRVSAVAQTW